MSTGFVHSVFDPHGPVALETANLGWMLIGGGTAIFVVVIALAGWALVAARRKRAWLAGESAIAIGGIVIPAIVLCALLVYTLGFGHTLDGGRAAAGAEPIRIEVIGHQWWWRIRYLDRAGAHDFETANEIHLPVGAPVELVLTSDDVLHSVWIPGLAGKLDMIPGRVNRLRLSADREGVHRGPCAEFCGMQHAKMALTVVAEAPAQFDAWRSRQRQPATAGNPTFDARCAACHSIRGTLARGMLGPDLTHVGGRRMLGAGTIDNNSAALEQWIAHSQQLKPGNLMPDTVDIGRDELAELGRYLASLD